MKNKTTALILVFFLLTAVGAFAQTAQEIQNVFPLFLAKLTERNAELKSLAMPDVEILTAPGFEGEAVYLANFKTPEDGQIFYAALEKEDIPCLTFPNDDKQIGLFHTDLLVFLMKAAIGL